MDVTATRINLRHYKFDGFTYTRGDEVFCGSPVYSIEFKSIRGKPFQRGSLDIQFYKLGGGLESHPIGFLGPKSVDLYWQNNAKAIERHNPTIKVRHQAKCVPTWEPMEVVPYVPPTTR